MQDEQLKREFTATSEAFNSAPVLSTEQALGSMVALVEEDPEARWIETACGPGMISRAVAPRVGEVVGIDLTPAMIEVAEREAAAAGLENASFRVGDGTELPFDDASFDGGLNRFTIHHVPLAGRLIGELARVVRPGGSVVISDLVADPGHDAAIWREEIDRLRDPSHWYTRTIDELREIGRGAGLALEDERVLPFELELDGWLERSTGGVENRELIDLALSDPPVGLEHFVVSGVNESRQVRMSNWVSLWRRR